MDNLSDHSSELFNSVEWLKWDQSETVASIIDQLGDPVSPNRVDLINPKTDKFAYATFHLALKRHWQSRLIKCDTLRSLSAFDFDGRNVQEQLEVSAALLIKKYAKVPNKNKAKMNKDGKLRRTQFLKTKDLSLPAQQSAEKVMNNFESERVEFRSNTKHGAFFKVCNISANAQIIPTAKNLQGKARLRLETPEDQINMYGLLKGQLLHGLLKRPFTLKQMETDYKKVRLRQVLHLGLRETQRI